MAARKARGPAPAARSGDDEAARAPAARGALRPSSAIGAEREVASGRAPRRWRLDARARDRSHGRAIVPYAAAARGVLLRVVPPTDLADSPLDVQVRGANQHEIATRVIDRASAIEVRIPPSWLVPGDYVVTLQPVGRGRGGRRAEFSASPSAPRPRREFGANSRVAGLPVTARPAKPLAP
jgi:hypothetical protein